jgi:hypothetical protein
VALIFEDDRGLERRREKVACFFEGVTSALT